MSTARVPRANLDQLAGQLRAQGLRALVDPVLDLVRADCPDCDAGATDPDGIYLPLAVIPRAKLVTFRCDSCGAKTVRNVR